MSKELPTLCKTCPNYTSGCEHIHPFNPFLPGDLVEETENAYRLCWHYTCFHGRESARLFITHDLSTIIRLNGEEVKAYPVATEDKPTCNLEDFVAIYGDSSVASNLIAKSFERRQKLVDARFAKLSGTLFRRYVLEDGTVVSTDRNGDLKPTGQKIEVD